MTNRCCKRVFREHWFAPCSKAGKFEHEGKLYCSVHYPPNVEKRNKESHERWQRKWDEKRKVREDAVFAQSELKRKAAEYDRLRAIPELASYFQDAKP